MASWDDLDWKQFENVFQGHAQVPEKAGAYAIRCTANGTPRPVSRAFATDASGILCFGRSAEREAGLRGRLTDLWRATAGKKAPHAEGRRYYDLNYSKRGFPRNALEIAWVGLDRQSAERQELEWFDEYLDAFGELPPLNRKRG